MSSSILTTAVVIAVILIAFYIFYHTVKSLFKLAAMVIALALIYAGYLYYTGQKIPLTREEIVKHGSERIETLKEKLNDTVKKPAGP